MLQPDDVGKPLPESEVSWTEREIILYALGVGAGRDELRLVYEGAGLVTLPTFGVLAAFPVFSGLGRVLDFDHRMTLHGRQRLVLDRPIPPSGSAITRGTVDQVWDKGSAAVLVARSETHLPTGERLLVAEGTAFVRNGGGFGGQRGPSSVAREQPVWPPDAELSFKTTDVQALLYRLSGDFNPLHADQEVAKAVGFDGPILHGLCTYGIVGRQAFMTFADADPRRFKAIDARFAGIVYPGETLVTSFWSAGGGLLRFVTKVAERDVVVLDDGVIEVAS